MLTQAEIRIMLAEIGRTALAVGRDLSGDTDAIALDLATGPDAGALSGRERLGFLAEALPAVERAVTQIAAAPRRDLRPALARTPIGRVRRPQPGAIAAALRREEVEAAVVPASTSWLAERLGGRLPRALEEAVPVPTADTPENRAVRALLVRWRRDLETIRALAEWEAEEPIAREALRLEERFRRLTGAVQAATEAADAPPARWTESALRDPRYRALHGTERRYRRLLAYAWEAPQLTVASREPWLLYEMWCFFRVILALRGAGLRAVDGDAVRTVEGRVQVTLAKGHASRLRFRSAAGANVVLYYQRAFPGASGAGHGISSRTHMMIPDISLERDGRLLLLDPKFRDYQAPTAPPDAAPLLRPFSPADRPGSALLYDLDKMHAYRDAIVRDGQPVVDGAWCLFPGSDHAAKPVIAYPPSTPETPFGTAGVGAIALRPGRDDGALVALLNASGKRA